MPLTRSQRREQGRNDSSGNLVDMEDEEMSEDDDEYSYNYSSGEESNISPTSADPNKDTSSSSQNGVKLVESTELDPEMRASLKEVSDILDVPEDVAFVLMRDFRWNKERLLEAFYDGEGGGEVLLQKYGVGARCGCCSVNGNNNEKSSSIDNQLLSLSQSSNPDKMEDKEVCLICADEFEVSEMFGIPCQHLFCKDCWVEYLTHQINEGPTVAMFTTCPSSDCKEAVTANEVKALVPELYPKYEEFQRRVFVEYNPLTRWCPGAGCSKIAVAPSHSHLTSSTCVKCECDAEFCLKCGEEPHVPVKCAQIAKWKEKCKNESETANWILVNTKACPKCSSRIEKNQGCNHMTCQQCRYEFCWICMENWTDHGANTGGYYKCNKFDPNNTDDNSDKAKAQRELDRYLHYYKRYHAHSEAQRFATKQLQETEQRMIRLQESSADATWIDVEFLKKATEQLVACRRVLKYTYTYAYYLNDEHGSPGQRERFEHHQEMLEKFTENLSEMSERPLAEMDRSEVTNQTRVVDKFMKNVLQYVEDGMEE